MKTITTIVLVVAATLGCLVVSLFITWCAWEIQLGGSAFHCTDDGLSIAFWESASTHETAGDKIIPGWTWQKVRIANAIYELCFFALWIGGSIVTFRAIGSITKDDVIEPR
jgi:hypothetical protein